MRRGSDAHTDGFSRLHPPFSLWPPLAPHRRGVCTMKFSSVSALSPLALGLAIALTGAALANWLHIPLPWMLGPLLLTAATRIGGLQSRCHPVFNKAGRWIIGLSLGLYFTPVVAQSVWQYWPLMLLCCAYAMVLAAIGFMAYQRFAGLDRRTAWFAAAIGSASEMAHLSEQYGARTDQVATVHSLRVMLVVVIVPFAFYGFHDPSLRQAYAANLAVVDWPGLALLALGAWLSALVFERLHVPNGWMLGPLCFAMAITLADVHLSALPQWVSWMGQLFIGWFMGDKYRPGFFKTAPRLLTVTAGLSVFFIALSSLIGWGLATALGLPVETLILGFVPGGIAEMTITAKVLGLGVPLVTALQVARMLCVVFSTGPIYSRWLAKMN